MNKDMTEIELLAFNVAAISKILRNDHADGRRTNYHPSWSDAIDEAAAALRSVDEDAARWRALMSSQRMHFIGCAGIELVNKPGTTGRKTADLIPVMKPGEYQHFGMEFWSTHAAFGNPEYPDDFERSLLVAYVDHLRNLPRERSYDAAKRDLALGEAT